MIEAFLQSIQVSLHYFGKYFFTEALLGAPQREYRDLVAIRIFLLNMEIEVVVLHLRHFLIRVRCGVSQVDSSAFHQARTRWTRGLTTYSRNPTRPKLS